MKTLTGLYMLTTAVTVVYAIIQRKEIKELNERIDVRGNLMDIQNEIVKGSNRGLELIKCWYTDGKITLDMVDKYVDAVDVDGETKSKIENL